MLIRARRCAHRACRPTIMRAPRKTYSYKHIQTSPPGSKAAPRRLSAASPVCLSCHPFHHSVILLSVGLHSSAIIGQKKKSVTHTSSLRLIRLLHSEVGRRKEAQAKPRRSSTIISFTVFFFSDSGLSPCSLHPFFFSLVER